MTEQVRRVSDARAYVLHRRPFRDTSQIVDVIARDYGRLSLVARGARAKRSKIRGVLQPFTPLLIGWSIRTELGTLTQAEAASAQLALHGDLLHSGFYLNELLLKLTHRFDPQPEIFDLYTKTLSQLAGANARPDAILRQFEFEFLSLNGYGVALRHDIVTGAPLEPSALYRVRPDAGPLRVSEHSDGLVFDGATLDAVADQQFDQPEVLIAGRRIARAALELRLDGKELRTRQVMREIVGHRQNSKE